MPIIVAATIAYATITIPRTMEKAMTQMNQLETWLAQEKEVQARLDAGAGCGVARPEQVAGRTGLETLQAMLRGELPYPPMARTLSFQLLEVEAGRAVFQGQP